MIAKGFGVAVIVFGIAAAVVVVLVVVIVVVDIASNPPKIIRYTTNPSIPPIKGILIK